MQYKKHSIAQSLRSNERGNTKEKIDLKFQIDVNIYTVQMNVMALFVIIEGKINFSFGFGNTDYQTNKLQNVHALHCKIVLYIVP